MKIEAKLIYEGTVTSPRGFTAGAASAGIKPEGVPDLGILYSDIPCAAAGLFTTNKIKAAPVILSQRHLEDSRTQAVVVNSGCANACTGVQGDSDALEMAQLTAVKLGIALEDVLVASTGVIGETLPLGKVRKGIETIALSSHGGHNLAEAILTTDTTTKEIAVDAGGIRIGGIAKGAGMIHPDMATMLCFLTTDAAVEADYLYKALQKAVDVSFNMISVDGDTSTNDMIVILANGMAGKPKQKDFEDALQGVCTYLAKCIVSDGEGSTRLIEATVEGAVSISDARIAARTIASSTLVKTAVHSGNPNWGRIIAAVGRCGVEVVESKIDLYLDNICVLKNGCSQPFDAKEVMTTDEVLIRVCLNLGKAEATAWGCDLSEEYVTINSEYTT